VLLDTVCLLPGNGVTCQAFISQSRHEHAICAMQRQQVSHQAIVVAADQQ
jgi:hypothetical protein